MAHWNDDGGHAHPRTGYLPDLSTVAGDDLDDALSTVTVPVDGMTLRDWFAGKALDGLTAGRAGKIPAAEPELAAKAYAYAQAMIAEKNRIEAAEHSAWQAERKRRRETGEQNG